MTSSVSIRVGKIHDTTVPAPMPEAPRSTPVARGVAEVTTCHRRPRSVVASRDRQLELDLQRKLGMPMFWSNPDPSRRLDHGRQIQAMTTSPISPAINKSHPNGSMALPGPAKGKW